MALSSRLSPSRHPAKRQISVSRCSYTHNRDCKNRPRRHLRRGMHPKHRVREGAQNAGDSIAVQGPQRITCTQRLSTWLTVTSVSAARLLNCLSSCSYLMTIELTLELMTPRRPCWSTSQAARHASAHGQLQYSVGSPVLETFSLTASLVTLPRTTTFSAGQVHVHLLNACGSGNRHQQAKGHVAFAMGRKRSRNGAVGSCTPSST